MGILEGAGVPDMFADALFSISSWDPSYYTLDGVDTDRVTAIENLSGNPFPSDSLASQVLNLQTESDGTSWFKSATTVGVGALKTPAAETQALLQASSGFVVVTSGRFLTDQVAGSRMQGDGWSPFYTTSAGRISPATGTSDTAFSLYDQFDSITVPTNLSTDGLAKWIGYLKAPLGPLGGVYNPATNVLSAPAYSADRNFVTVWFYEPGGLRAMFNGTNVSLRLAQAWSAAGASIDAPLEAAELSADYSGAAMYARLKAAIPSYNITTQASEINAGGHAIDYIGVFQGGVYDDLYYRTLSALLLQSKPTV